MRRLLDITEALGASGIPGRSATIGYLRRTASSTVRSRPP